jgi:hypothetical protein
VKDESDVASEGIFRQSQISELAAFRLGRDCGEQQDTDAEVYANQGLDTGYTLGFLTTLGCIVWRFCLDGYTQIARDRKREMERGTLAGFRIYPNPAAVILDDSFTDGQT